MRKRCVDLWVDHDPGDEAISWEEVGVCDPFPETSVKIATINVNSMMRHMADIMEIDADILIIAETRLTRADVPEATRLLQTKGYMMISRAVVPEESRPSHVGVAVLVRAPLKIFPAQVPEESELGRWIALGRLEMACVVLPDDTTLHVLGHYAHADHRWNQDNEWEQLQLIEQIEKWKISTGAVRCIWGGDFNCQPTDKVYEAVRAHGLWIDPHAQGDLQRDATFISPVGTSTIDFLFVDEAMWSTVKKTGVELATTVQHRPVWMMSHLAPQGKCLQDKMPLSDPAMYQVMDQEKQPEWAWQFLERELMHAYRCHQVERTWTLWCKRWEELLITRMLAAGVQPTRVHRGRGVLPDPESGEFHVPARYCGQSWPLRVRQLMRLRSQCHEAQVQSARYQARLVQYGLVDDTFQLTPQNLDETHLRVHHALQHAQADVRTTRWSRWKGSLIEKGFKKAYSFVAAKHFASTQGVKSADGETALTAAQATATLQGYWRDIYNHEPETDCGVLCANVEARYHKYAQPQQRMVPDVSDRDIADAVAHLKLSGAPGPGGWRPADLKALPHQAWVELMHLAHLYEVDHFPAAMREMYVTLISKLEEGETPGPQDLRPIAVGSSVYRVYSRARAAKIAPVVEDFMHKSQFGARAGKSLHQPIAMIATRIDEGLRGKRHWHGLSLDIMKCFDTLPVCAVAQLLQMAGADQTTAERTQATIASLRKRWRLPARTLSDYIQQDRGLPQGCSLSVLMANLYIALLMHHLAEGVEQKMIVCAYCDDVLLLSEDPALLDAAWEKVVRWAKTLQIKINEKKSYVFTTCPEVRQVWSQGNSPGNLPIVDQFKYLGVWLDTVQKNPQEHLAQKHLDKAQARLKRIQALPVSFEVRGLLSMTTIMTGLLFSPWGWRWTTQQWTTFRSQLMASVQGGLPRKARAAAEIFFLIFLKGHRLEPRMARATAAMHWVMYFFYHEDAIMSSLVSESHHQHGVVARLMGEISQTGLTMTHPGVWANSQGDVFDVRKEVRQGILPATWHRWRHCLRQQVLADLAVRRPAFEGVLQVCRKRTLRHYHTLTDPRDKGIFRILAMDAVMSRERCNRLPQDQMCIHCGQLETVMHILWSCPAWMRWRTVQLPNCEGLPMATLRCGLIQKDAPPQAERVQVQLMEIVRQYMHSLPPRQRAARQPQPMPRPDRSRLLTTPMYRIRTKTTPDLVTMMPSRPSVEPWVFAGHEGECRRSGGQWRAYCHRCHLTRLWNKRHLVSECPQRRKGERVLPAEGFEKVEDEGKTYVSCLTCRERSLWCSKQRFERRHHCRRDVHGQVLPCRASATTRSEGPGLYPPCAATDCFWMAVLSMSLCYSEKAKPLPDMVSVASRGWQTHV